MAIVARARLFVESLRAIAGRTEPERRCCPTCGSSHVHRHGSYTRRPYTLQGRWPVHDAMRPLQRGSASAENPCLASPHTSERRLLLCRAIYAIMSPTGEVPGEPRVLRGTSTVSRTFIAYPFGVRIRAIALDSRRIRW